MAKRNPDKNDIVKLLIEDIENEEKYGYNQKSLEKLQKDLEDSLQTDLPKNLIKDAQELQKQANIFYETLLKLAKTKNNYLTALTTLGSVSEGYKARTYRLRLAYLAAFKFAKYIHNYLGLPPAEALVVFENDDGKPYTIKMSLIDLVKSAGSAGHLHSEWLQTVSKETDSLEIEMQKSLGQNHVIALQKAYQIVSNKMKDGVQETKGNTYIRLRKPNSNKWSTYNIINKGDLKEAYATALFQEHTEKMRCLLCDTKKEEDLAYIFFRNYVMKVDSKEALLGEDIILKTIQYAVKAENAQLPSLAQYIRAAQGIRNLKKNELEDGIKAFFEKENKNFKGSVRNKYRKSVPEAVKKAFKNI